MSSSSWRGRGAFRNLASLVELMAFGILDTVRVVRLREPEREVTSAFEPAPQPRVGQLATIVEDVGEGIYLVECTTDDGVTAWLAEFTDDELELVDRAPTRR